MAVFISLMCKIELVMLSSYFMLYLYELTSIYIDIDIHILGLKLCY